MLSQAMAQLKPEEAWWILGNPLLSLGYRRFYRGLGGGIGVSDVIKVHQPSTKITKRVFNCLQKDSIGSLNLLILDLKKH